MGVLRTFEQSCKSAADASQKQLLSTPTGLIKKSKDTVHFSAVSLFVKTTWNILLFSSL